MATPIYLATAFNGDTVTQNVFDDELTAKSFVENKVKPTCGAKQTWSGLIYENDSDEPENYGRVDVITAGLSDKWDHQTE